MSARRSLLLRTAALALLPLTLAACSTGGTQAAGAQPTGSASPPANPDAGLLDGTQLKALLLPGTVLPKGYKIDPSTTRDTGKGFAPSARRALDLKNACQNLEVTGLAQSVGVDSAAFAQTDFTNSAQEEFNEEIDSFRGTDAHEVMTRLEQVFTHCAHFTDSTGGTAGTVTVKMTKVTGVGDETLKAVEFAPQWQGGTTLVATRVGNVLITTLYNVQSGDMGAAALEFSKKIAEKVKAATPASSA